MAPGAHLLISWLSTVELLKFRRERTIVALSGVAPDADGFGIIWDKLTGTTDFYFRFHHYLGHSLLTSVVLAVFATLLAKTQKVTVFVLTVVVVHLHIICDIIGSKGPDGYQWPIYYLYPFSSEFSLTWSYQWELNAWQNHVIMLVLFSCCFYYVVTKHFSFIEVFSSKLDQAAFSMYRKYFQKNAEEGNA